MSFFHNTTTTTATSSNTTAASTTATTAAPLLLLLPLLPLCRKDGRLPAYAPDGNEGARPVNRESSHVIGPSSGGAEPRVSLVATIATTWSRRSTPMGVRVLSRLPTAFGAVARCRSTGSVARTIN